MRRLGPDHIRLLKKLSYLPNKIVSLHGTENISEFLMHELCNEECFNFSKAAYLVDNPDFNTIKGVAGFDCQEIFLEVENIWQEPERFSKHMKSVPFNQQVRMFEKDSFKKECVCDEDIIQAVAQALNIENPDFHCWHLKHDNHGLMLFEHQHAEPFWDDEDLENAFALLSLCPVF